MSLPVISHYLHPPLPASPLPLRYFFVFCLPLSPSARSWPPPGTKAREPGVRRAWSTFLHRIRTRWGRWGRRSTRWASGSERRGRRSTGLVAASRETITSKSNVNTTPSLMNAFLAYCFFSLSRGTQPRGILLHWGLGWKSLGLCYLKVNLPLQAELHFFAHDRS